MDKDKHVILIQTLHAECNTKGLTYYLDFLQSSLISNKFDKFTKKQIAEHPRK